MSTTSSSHNAGGQSVTPTQLLIKEVIEAVKQLNGKIDALLTRQELTNFKLDLICTEDDGEDDYEMEMEEPTTPKKMKYKK